MKIYENEKGEIVIDGDHCTTIEFPSDLENYGDKQKIVDSFAAWIDERFPLFKGKTVVMTNFRFDPMGTLILSKEQYGLLEDSNEINFIAGGPSDEPFKPSPARQGFKEAKLDNVDN